jgi:hypothetical protein
MVELFSKDILCAIVSLFEKKIIILETNDKKITEK